MSGLYTKVANLYPTIDGDLSNTLIKLVYRLYMQRIMNKEERNGVLKHARPVKDIFDIVEERNLEDKFIDILKEMQYHLISEIVEKAATYFITPLEKIITVRENEDLELSCKLNNNKLAVNWTKNGIEITPRKNTKFSSDHYQTLTITSVTLNDAGIYRCEIGGNETECIVEITENLQGYDELQDNIAEEGSSVVLEISFDRRIKTPAKWFKNNQELNDQNGKYSFYNPNTENRRIKIYRVSSNDAGRYTVKCGNVVKEAELIVKDSREIEEELEEMDQLVIVNKLFEARERLINIVAEKEVLLKQHKELQRKLESYQRENQELRNEISELRQKITQLENEIKRLEVDNKRILANIEFLQKQLQKQTNDHDEFLKKLDERLQKQDRRETRRYQVQLNSQDQFLKKLEEDRKRKEEDAKRKTNTGHCAIQNQRKLESYQRENQELRNEIAELRQKITHLENKIKQLEVDNKRILAKIEFLQKQLKKQKKDHDEFLKKLEERLQKQDMRETRRYQVQLNSQDQFFLKKLEADRKRKEEDAKRKTNTGRVCCIS